MKNDTLVLMLSTALLFAVSAGSATTTELSQASESDEIDYGDPKYGSDYREEVIKNKSPLLIPPEDSELYEQLLNYTDEVVLLIQTINENEFWAAVDTFGPPMPLLNYTNGECVSRLINFHKVRIYLGTFGGYKAALIQTKMGADCRYEIEEALEIFPNVQAVLGVGIGYGNNRDDVMFGDVLVSARIEDISNVKFDKHDEIIPRGEITQIRPVLMDIFAKQMKTFAIQTGFVCTLEGRPPSIEDGLVVSAPWLIDNLDIKDRLLESQPEAIGGEMEGWVLISIQKNLENQPDSRIIGVIIIKGVCDFGDGTKDRNWQMTAAMASFSYAKFQLEQTQGQAFRSTADVMDTITDQVPALDELTVLRNDAQGIQISITDSIQPQWEKLARYLSLEKETISSLATDTFRSPTQKVAVVFDEWLNGEGREDKSWSVVVEFLNNMGLEEVASKIPLALKQ